MKIQRERLNYRSIKTGLQMDTIMDFAIINYLRVRVVECTRAQQFQTSQPDIIGTVSIRIIGMATGLANKLGLRFPIFLFNVATLAALFRCIIRRNLNQRNSRKPRLVGNKAIELIKAPIMKPCPLPLSSPIHQSNASQSLNGNSSIRAFRGLDDAFRNYVIYVARKISLSAAPFFKESFCRFGSFFLKFPTEGLVSIANLIQMASRVIYTIRIVCNFNDTKINSKAINYLNLFFFWNIYNNVQKPSSFTQNKIRLPDFIGKHRALFFSTNERDFLSPINSPNACRGLHEIKRQNMIIVSNTGVSSKDSLSFLIKLIRGSHPVICEANHLRGNRKFISYFPVKFRMQPESVKQFYFPSQLRNTVGRAINNFNGGSEYIRLLFSWEQLNFNNEFQ